MSERAVLLSSRDFAAFVLKTNKLELTHQFTSSGACGYVAGGVLGKVRDPAVKAIVPGTAGNVTCKIGQKEVSPWLLFECQKCTVSLGQSA